MSPGDSGASTPKAANVELTGSRSSATPLATTVPA